MANFQRAAWQDKNAIAQDNVQMHWQDTIMLILILFQLQLWFPTAISDQQELHQKSTLRSLTTGTKI